MASNDKPLHLFEGYGIEMEYMVVDRLTLKVRPIVDKIIYEVAQGYPFEVVRGETAWCNELVSHVIEIKCNGPVASLAGLDRVFHEQVRDLNSALAKHGACLLPGGAHPFMDPFTETVIWPHENSEIYDLYDALFDCRGHGWSNLQSTHLNLPFHGDDEFGRLHAAIRILLPIIPALSASSPILDGALTGHADSRLEAYRVNQRAIPSLTGAVIPEPAFTEADYEQAVFEPMLRDLAPHDPKGILEKYFVNSRGAIARFDRGAIEIRILDTQECPRADIAVISAVSGVLKKLTEGAWISHQQQREWETARLSEIFLSVIRDGERAIIRDTGYLAMFGAGSTPCNAGELWKRVLAGAGVACSGEMQLILEQGTLATRIVRALGGDVSQSNLVRVYRRLADCLQQNTMFES